MRTLRIGLCQMNSRDNREENFCKIEEMTEYCAGEGAEVVLFPEQSTYLSARGVLENAEPLEGKIVNRLREIARKNKVYLHNGSFLEKAKTGNKVHNTSVFIDPQGDILTTYRKIHLFDVEIPGSVSNRESDTVEPGKEVVTCKTGLANFGFSICYDLRFPELFRRLTDAGAEVVFLPAAFTLYTGKDHWEPLLRARAIENQIYLVAVNQTGTFDQKSQTYGNSLVVDPWGTVIARAREEVGCTVAALDLDFITRVREKIPSLKNRVNLS